MNRSILGDILVDRQYQSHETSEKESKGSQHRHRSLGMPSHVCLNMWRYIVAPSKPERKMAYFNVKILVCIIREAASVCLILLQNLKSFPRAMVSQYLEGLIKSTKVGMLIAILLFLCNEIEIRTSELQ